MKDIGLLNELEMKIRELVSTLERERQKNIKSDESTKVSQKLSLIEEKVKNLINLIEQLEKS
tara:strand:- start:1653 stop:1838 length:186 start_codon:yes stop_codon:yes gene_type:complete